ncbi:hypothetical protein RRG08_022388 [Elysia crispata]|uniref:Secreted protein n=1 Tax=Elysia crispata TaxID=231223 RepID=A0AAE1D897_9GAST|nr:hypothetical protein RRG08_022388 [Elysia crispata]
MLRWQLALLSGQRPALLLAVSCVDLHLSKTISDREWTPLDPSCAENCARAVRIMSVASGSGGQFGTGGGHGGHAGGVNSNKRRVCRKIF